MADDPAGARWHLDRRIPLALILTISLQTGLGIWWASRINAIQEAHSQRILVLEERQDIIRQAIPRMEERQQQILRALHAD